MCMRNLLFITLSLMYFTSTGQRQSNENQIIMKINGAKENKMKVEIWSDIMCPFCYIGKRKFEAALASFPQRDSVEVVWLSFQLDPSITYQAGTDAYTYLAERKGQTRSWSVQMHNSVAQSAKAVGLEYNFDIVKVANSFDAHRVIQLAKKHLLGNEIEERFFKAYFCEGALMSDHETLVQLAAEVGLDREEVRNVLESQMYADEVRKDGEDARRFGANGVPFFVMDRKYAVSGAQDSSVFLETLTKAFNDWKLNNQVFTDIPGGNVCTPAGECK